MISDWALTGEAQPVFIENSGQCFSDGICGALSLLCRAMRNARSVQASLGRIGQLMNLQGYLFPATVVLVLTIDQN